MITNDSTTLKVLINGYAVPEYIDGQYSYIESELGEAYTLEVITPVKSLVVVTVDGLSVLTGEPGSIHKPHGYIAMPYRPLVIAGWRTSTSKVNAFKFTELGNSYVSQGGSNGDADPENAGVIGCAVYSEKQLYRYPPEVNFEQTKCCYGPSSNERGGKPVATGFGKEVESQVTMSSFNNEDNPRDILIIRYAPRDVLVKKGLIPIAPIVPVLPNLNPFPADNFWCKPPVRR